MRFEREAKTLAALNHPHIAQIYGIEDRAIVMELVEGEDLAERTARGRSSAGRDAPIARVWDQRRDSGADHRRSVR